MVYVKVDGAPPQIEAVVLPNTPLILSIYRIGELKRKSYINHIMPSGKAELEKTIEITTSGSKIRIRTNFHQQKLEELLSPSFELLDGGAIISLALANAFFGPLNGTHVIRVSHGEENQTIIPIYCRGKEEEPSQLLNVAGWPDFIIKYH